MDAEGPPAPAVGRGGRRRDQAVALGWLVVVWLLLWGDVSWGNLLGGLLVGAAVLVFFPLPPVTFGGRVRPGALLVLAVTFVAELVSASVHVAAIAVRPGYRPRGAIIAVPLRIRTDLNLALTAEVISLVPGTLILEVDRDHGVLYVHVLDVRGPADLTAGRDRILAVERRVVRAVGSAEEVRRLHTETVDRRTAP
nr:Na+/H+ antiporter subunit E [Micromonospora auratinigra]